MLKSLIQFIQKYKYSLSWSLDLGAGYKPNSLHFGLEQILSWFSFWAILRITKYINSEQEKYDLAASFQKTIEEILYIKSKIAFREFLKNSFKEKFFVVAGGVAANKGIRKKLIEVSNENGFKAIFPDIKLCGDNAAMIALVGLEKYKINKFDNMDLEASPRLALDASAKFLKGAGVVL